MNKHLFDTKLRSIAHYDSEEKKFEEALKVNRDIRTDLVNSLKEFFPFEYGDIIRKDDWIIKFSHIHSMVFNDQDDIRFCIKYFEYDGGKSRFETGECRYSATIRIEDLKEWSKI